MPRFDRMNTKASLWQRIRPKGIRFSFVGSALLLFTGTLGYLMVRFPQFVSLRITFFVMFLINALFFVRFREKGRAGLVERMMDSKFFPRKLTFTREGKFLVLITLGMGFAAVNTGSNLLYLLLSMLLSIIVASGILSELSVRRLSWTHSFPNEAVAREETLFPIRVENNKRRLHSYSLEGVVLLRDAALDVLRYRGLVFRLAPRTCETLSSRVVFPRRGIYRLRGLSLGTRYPFSFFRKARQFELEHEVIVVPQGVLDVHQMLHTLARGHDEQTNTPGRGGEFFSVRGMHSGDEWRDVHWKQTAKFNRFAVKEYEALKARRVVLELAWNPAPDPAAAQRQEQGIELAASVIRHLIRRGYEVGLRAPGVVVPPAGGPGGLRQAFLTLSLLCLDDETVPLPGFGPSARDARIAVDLDHLRVEVFSDPDSKPSSFTLEAGGEAA